MKPLLFLGRLHLADDTVSLAKFTFLAQQNGLEFQLFHTDRQGVLEAVLSTTVMPNEHVTVLHFLKQLGEDLAGQVMGELEVWWQDAGEAGPQWWELDAEGRVFVTESEITRGPRTRYEE